MVFSSLVGLFSLGFKKGKSHKTGHPRLTRSLTLLLSGSLSLRNRSEQAGEQNPTPSFQMTERKTHFHVVRFVRQDVSNQSCLLCLTSLILPRFSWLCVCVLDFRIFTSYFRFVFFINMLGWFHLLQKHSSIENVIPYRIYFALCLVSSSFSKKSNDWKNKNQNKPKRRRRSYIVLRLLLLICVHVCVCVSDVAYLLAAAFNVCVCEWVIVIEDRTNTETCVRIDTKTNGKVFANRRHILLLSLVLLLFVCLYASKCVLLVWVFAISERESMCGCGCDSLSFALLRDTASVWVCEFVWFSV